MKCASCQHENQADALFYEGCGVKLLATCAECGADLGAGITFEFAAGDAINVNLEQYH